MMKNALLWSVLVIALLLGLGVAAAGLFFYIELNKAQNISITEAYGADALAIPESNLIELPQQQEADMPFIHLSNGMFDSSAYVIFKASDEWVTALTEKYRLTPSQFPEYTRPEIQRIAEISPAVKKLLAPGSEWKSFDSSEVFYEREGQNYSYCFILYVSEQQKLALLHYMSPTRIKSIAPPNMCDYFGNIRSMSFVKIIIIKPASRKFPPSLLIHGTHPLDSDILI